ncbi:hypothetical protein GOB86_09615 [Acetobacter lambici]|uniref:hypothetical protein n=1 Tax=Acetobacter lambici TaxID=1332824 RepID=UPI00140E27BE|nr:hypothetical protein [Acetobacter lambici]NHO57313.1 hypothetical protein [Acetobacter lambici]
MGQNRAGLNAPPPRKHQRPHSAGTPAGACPKTSNRPAPMGGGDRSNNPATRKNRPNAQNLSLPE